MTRRLLLPQQDIQHLQSAVETMEDSSMSTPNLHIDRAHTPDFAELEPPPTPTAITPVYATLPRAGNYVGLYSNTYPDCDNADVVIISPTGQRWKLHSLFLTNASPHFRQLFNTNDPVKLSKKDKDEGKTIRWKLRMVQDPQAHDVDPNGSKFRCFQVVAKNDLFSFGDNFNGLGDQDQEYFNKLYDNFFRCLYNLDPNFTNDVDGHTQATGFILDATMLLQAAVYLDAVNSVRVIVEAHLLRLNQTLWRHIAARPEAWVQLAARLQSPLMFREAMLHIVGKWHLKNAINREVLSRDEFGALGQKILKLILQKHHELKQLKLTVERHLIEFYPDGLIHSLDKEGVVPGRIVFANDIYLWMALSMVRQYIASAFERGSHHRAADGGLSLYRTLGSAEATYIRQKTVEKFHANFEMSAKGRACFNRALNAIKSEIKPLLHPLLVDRSQATREPDAPRFPYLTCTEIHDSEMPWYEDLAPTPDAGYYGMDYGYYN